MKIKPSQIVSLGNPVTYWTGTFGEFIRSVDSSQWGKIRKGLARNGRYDCATGWTLVLGEVKLGDTLLSK